MALLAFACSSPTTVEPPPVVSPSVAPAILPAKTTVYVAASSVNVRRDPSMTG
jgi:hypothetical protein